MNKKALLPLALIVVTATFSGCAHQKTRTGSQTSILGGLVEIERGAFQPAPVMSIDGNLNELVGDAGKPVGTQVRVAWGVITTNSY